MVVKLSYLLLAVLLASVIINAVYISRFTENLYEISTEECEDSIESYKAKFEKIKKICFLSRYADSKWRFWRAFVIFTIRSSMASVYFPAAIRRFLLSIRTFKSSLFSSAVRYTSYFCVLIQSILQIFTVKSYIERTNKESNYAILLNSNLCENFISESCNCHHC